MESLRDIVAYLRANRRWWLLPVIVLVLLLGGILALGASSPVGPFIYTLF